MATRRQGKIKILPHMHLKVSEIPSHPCETDKELLSSSVPAYGLTYSQQASSKGASVNCVDHNVTRRVVRDTGKLTHSQNKSGNNRNQNKTTNTESQTNLIHVDSTELNRTRLENSGKPVHKQTPKVPVRSAQTVLHNSTEVLGARNSDSESSGSPHQYQQHHPRHLYNLLHTGSPVKASKDKTVSGPADVVDQRHLSSPLQEKVSRQLKYSPSRRKLPEVPVRTSSLRNYSNSSSSSSSHKEDHKQLKRHTDKMIENTSERLSIELHETDIIDRRKTSESASESEAVTCDANIGRICPNRITENNAAFDDSAVIVSELNENDGPVFRIISGNTKDMIGQVGETEIESDALKSFSDFLKSRTKYKQSELSEDYVFDRELNEKHKNVSRERMGRLDYDPADDLLKEVNDLLDSAEEIGKNFTYDTHVASPKRSNVHIGTSDLNNGRNVIASGISGTNNNSSARKDAILPRNVDNTICVDKITTDEQQVHRNDTDSDNSGDVHLLSERVRGVESVNVNKGYCDSETSCDVMINKLLSATHEVNDIVNNVDSQHSDGANSPGIMADNVKTDVQPVSGLCSDNDSVNKAGNADLSLPEVPEITITAEHLFNNVDTTSAEHKESLKTAQVLRTPSYRKRVIAKARTKYGRSFKKSSECTCQADDMNMSYTWDRKELCTFCELNRNFSDSPRSIASLGAASGGADSLSECEFLDQSSPRRVWTPGLPPLPVSPNPGSPRGQQKVKKVPVSSRVELLMSNDLFRKHLKRDALLRKHTYTYRKYGLQKSVSNLDLSDAFLYHDSTTDGEETNTTDAEEELLSKSHDMTALRHDSRRHSLTESDPALEQFQNHFKNLKDDILPRTLPKGNMKSRPPIPSFKEFRGGSGKSRKILPSFSEFRSNKPNITNQSAVDKPVMSRTGENNESDRDVSSHSPRLELGPITEAEGKDSAECLVDVVECETIDRVLDKIGRHDKKVEVCANSKSHVRDTKSKEKNVERDWRVKVDVNSNLTQDSGNNVIVTSHKPLESKLLKASANTGYDSTCLIQERITRSQSIPYLVTESLASSQELSVNERLLPEPGANLASQSSFSKLKDRRRKGAKRPRSLISKKSSLDELLNPSRNMDGSEKRDISERPRLRRGQSCRRPTRSKSDVCLNKARCDLSLSLPNYDSSLSASANADIISARKAEFSIQPQPTLKRINSDPTVKGSKKVSEYEDEELGSIPHSGLMDKGAVDGETDSGSQYSQDIGESDTTTSLAGSNISESLYSEMSKVEERLGSTEDDFSSELSHRVGADEDDLKYQIPVFRSTSDACDATPDAARKRRERKDRPYKSDPFSGTEIVPASKRYFIKEERAKLRQYRSMVSAAKDEILSFLDVATHGDLHQGDSFPSLEELNEDDEQNLNEVASEHGSKARNPSNVSTTSTDSGVIGQEWSHGSQQSSPSNTLQQGQTTWKDWEQTPGGSGRHITISSSCSDLTKPRMRECADCGLLQNPDVELGLCSRCQRQAVERRKIIQEIYDTEVSYGRDLNILKQEFYLPMGKVGLLTKHQLDCIFLNLDELIHVNTHFVTKMKSAIHSAQQNKDEDLQEIRVGSLFLVSSTMFLTFENYCVSQYQAPILLEQLEREKELLRIFLHVSQNDNHLLRRMHLKSFLMVPVQRIMKYPLLLDRLYKVTPPRHPDKDALKEAKDKINDILGHINAKSKIANQKQQKVAVEKHYSMTEKIEVSRVAIQILGWNRKDVCDVITSHLQITQPIDHLWAAKKCKNLKFTTVHGVLMTLGEPYIEADENRNLMFARPSPVRSAAVVLIKEKNGKFQPIRDPFLLEKCVVSQDPDYMDVFEILEWNKESLLLKGESATETALWVRNLKQQMAGLGCWRRRRNALPNIHLSHIT